MLGVNAAAMALAAIGLASASPLSTSPVAPFYVPEAPAHDVLNSTYIVMLRDNIPSEAFQAHLSFLQYANEVHPLQPGSASELDDDEDYVGSPIEHIYDSDIARGYAGRFSDSVLEMVRSRPEVRYVEQDRRIRAYGKQNNPPWGLARISHRSTLNSNRMHYLYSDVAGEGVMVYVLDGGVFVKHPEFQGRARWGTKTRSKWTDVDDDGHGTHCAGTIASRAYGVAKKAGITSVKVLGKNGGSSSAFIAGLEWTYKDADRLQLQAIEEYKTTGRMSFKGAVISASLGGPKSRSEIETVNKIVKRGIHMAVAAGNDHKDACGESPAAAEMPITVGASAKDDKFADFSNHGKCVDIIAPGVDILSCGHTMQRLTRMMSGTSMATPHVAGLMAYLLSIYPSTEFNPRLSSSERMFAWLGSAYTVLYSALPGFMSGIVPTPMPPYEQGMPASEVATLSPQRLKQAILKLASHNRIRGVPRNTPNLMIFNNASHAKYKLYGDSELEDDFWDGI